MSRAGGLMLEQLEAVLGKGLSAEQADVVTAPLQAGVVIAGAGSGKTTTMVARVVWLVGSGQVRPEGVLGLTFTTKAAAELATRVRVGLRALGATTGGLPPGEVAAEPTISTYHAYAARLVRDHALLLGREPTARLVTPATSWQLAARAVASYDGPMGDVDWAEATVVKAVLQLAGDLAEHLVGTPAVRNQGAWLTQRAEQASVLASKGVLAKAAEDVLACQRTREQLLPLVDRYAQFKRQRDLLDFGDVVALAARLAQRAPGVAETERASFPVVLLDEYQDTGSAQEVLLSSLFKGGHAVTAVGDPCQSIYGWRGASAGTLRRFPVSFGTGAPARTLSTTYRSGGRILQLANALSEPLRADEGGLPVAILRPAPGREQDGEVRCALLADVDAEASWVAGQVVAALGALPLRVGQGQWSRAAVLCRRRSLFPRLRQAFEALGVPVEVVGLGGLLDVPEVADILATLRVLDDPTADASLLRLLTGPRWRIGPRDLAILGRRARSLARGVAQRPDDPVQAVVLGVDESHAGSLIDALDDLPVVGLSEPGLARLTALRDELRALRRRLDQPLPDLAADIERTLGLDVEVAARVASLDPAAARADLDAFLDAAASFDGDAAQDGTGEVALSAFLAFLSAAQDEEHGLDTGSATGADTVKLMTVHAAKGLEWPVVAVPGLSAGSTSSVFPARSKTSTSWTRNARLLPFPLRGDRDDLPGLDGLEPGQLSAHTQANADRDAREERRLAYVAVTRAEQLLLCSGAHWGEGKGVLGPSVFLSEARVACELGAGPVEQWVEAPEVNPLTAAPRTAPWPSPRPPAGPAVQAAAARVRALLRLTEASSALVAIGAGVGEGVAATAVAGSPGDRAAAGANVDVAGPTAGGRVGDGLDGPGVAADRSAPTAPSGQLSPADRARVAGWDDDLLRLQQEAVRRRTRRGAALLPPTLSVSDLVELRRDPAALARSLLRPLPRRPSPVTRRGTAFHAWLEQVYGLPQLLDTDDLPGAADDGAVDTDLRSLQAAFQSSLWWGRTPQEIEVPFETDLEGVLVRGRLDAVFADPAGWDVVDWKTGRRPTGLAARAAAVQLAAYRLAWAALSGAPVESVRAAFHYVRTGETVRPADLLDAEGLRELVRQVPLV